jgi:hypothetical protein
MSLQFPPMAVVPVIERRDEDIGNLFFLRKCTILEKCVLVETEQRLQLSAEAIPSSRTRDHYLVCKISPIDKTNVPLTNDKMMYESNASISNKSTRLLFGGIKRSAHRLPSVSWSTPRWEYPGNPS